MLRAEANHEPGYYDIVHSHYWLSGQVGWLARDRWAVPLVHTAHTLAAVKNAALADGDAPEPPLRAVGEQQVVDEADRLIVNTEDEAQQLVSLHHADPARIDVVHPGVDLTTFTPGDRRCGPRRAGAGRGRERIVAFVGRIQPLKAPDVLLRAAALLPGVRVLVAGGPSGSGLAAPDSLVRLAAELGITDRVTFLPPQSREQLVERLPGRRSGGRAQLFGVLRAGRRRGAGLRYPGGGGGGRRAAGRGGRRAQRHPGGRPRAAAAGPSAIAELLDARSGGAEPGRRRSTPRQFSWDHTVDALLASYGRAIERLRPHPSAQRRRVTWLARRNGRRWTMRRGVRA